MSSPAEPSREVGRTDAAPAKLRRSEFHRLGATGYQLFRRSWIPSAPARSVVVVHGYAEHCGRYEHVATRLAADGCAVHAYDQQGHGRSEGVRCHVRSFSDFLDDLDAIVCEVRAENPQWPLFVVGHSMGGLIVAAYACERSPDVTGVATSGAALALAEDLSVGKLRAARWLQRLLPRFALSSNLDPQGLSRDPEVVRAYLDDPLVESKMTASLGAEIMSAIERTSAAARDVQVPMLLMHGEEDPLCPVSGSEAFFSQLGVPRQLRVYPKLRHEIFNEPEQNQVLGDLIGWMHEVESGADPA